jgi:hypothetical protein
MNDLGDSRQDIEVYFHGQVGNTLARPRTLRITVASRITRQPFRARAALLLAKGENSSDVVLISNFR